MFSKTNFFCLLRLYASNKTLLEIYYFLYEKLNGDEGNLQREQLSNRIAIRERIRLDLMICIEENYIDKEETFLEKASIYSMPVLSYLELANPNNLLPDTWERCQEQEIENLEKYLHTLERSQLCSKTRELLMMQKNRIEKSLYSYA